MSRPSLISKMSSIGSSHHNSPARSNQRADVDSSSSDDSDCETDSSFPAATPPKSSLDALKHRKALEEQAVRLSQAKEGDWLISVHVIECRELRATDADGTADPVVVVEADFGGGKKQRGVTRIVQNDRNAVFDETFNFEFAKLSRPDLEIGLIRITVIDSDAAVGGHGVGDLIGEWTADVLDGIYSRDDREFYRQFVCLENNEDNGEDASGTQGFVKLTVTATGPGDKVKVHDLEKELAAERKALEASTSSDGALTLPPVMSSMTAVELRFLVVKVHDLITLPSASSVIVKVEFGSSSFSTPPVKTRPSPVESDKFPFRWCSVNQSIWLAVLLPTMTQSIRITLWSASTSMMTSSKLLATAQLLKLSRVRQFPSKFQKCSLPLYGAQPSSSDKKMALQPNTASHYRGRITLSLEERSANRKDGSSRKQENRIKPCKQIQAPPLKIFEFKVYVHIAANLPKTKASTLTKNVFTVRVSCGETYAYTQSLPLKKGISTIDFSKAGVLTRSFSGPGDTMQVPDLIITLCKGKDRIPIAYTRIAAVSLLEQTAFDLDEENEPIATWVHLREDNAIDAIEDNVFPGSLLLKAGMFDITNLSTNPEHSAPNWEEESTASDDQGHVKIKVKINVIAGRDLPPWDADTGSLDAYIKVSMGGETVRTSVVRDTRNPDWYQSLEFELVVSRRVDLRPEIICKVWDEDRGIGESDDFVGNVLLPMRAAKPSWHSLFYQERGDIEGGQVMIGVEIEEAGDDDDEHGQSRAVAHSDDDAKAVVRSIPRMGKKATVEIVALGCRGLKSPSSTYKMTNPYAVMRIAHAASKQTQPSSRPTPESCSFSEVLHIEDVILPDDEALAPSLDVKVLDRAILGGDKLIGTGCFSLADCSYYVGKRSSKASRRSRTESSGSGMSEDENLDWVHQAPYMKDRRVLLGAMGCKPAFNVVALMRGKKKAVVTATSRFELETIGRMYLFARVVVDNEKRQKPTRHQEKVSKIEEALVERLRTPMRYKVRVYILEGKGLKARDAKTSDPYVSVKVGGAEVKTQVKKKTLNPEWYELVEMSCKMPGSSELELTVYDKDNWTSDDMIGKTSIDLESRWFSKDWHDKWLTKPIETRALMIHSSSQPQGFITVWVDIAGAEAPFPRKAKYVPPPIWDITPPPPAEFELRIVIWKVEGIPPGDEFSEQSDLFVKLRLGETDWRTTDTHYFAKKGKGSFNYRFKYPLKLGQGGKVQNGGEGSSYLKLQVWDADLLISDCLAETQIDLREAFKTAFNTRELGMEYSLFGESGKQLKAAAARLKMANDGEQKAPAEAADLATEETGLLAGDVGDEWDIEEGYGGVVQLDTPRRKSSNGSSKKDKKRAIKDEQNKRKKRVKKKKAKKGLLEGFRETLGLTAPENSGWISFTKVDLKTGKVEPRGKLLMTVEILPSSLSGRRKCGEGREEPNRFPVLPPPEGRVDFTKMMINPVYMMQTCLGDSLAKEVGCGCCCFLFVTAFVAAGVVLGPEIQILISILNMLPTAIAEWVVIGLLASTTIFCTWLCCCVCAKDKHDPNGEDSID